MKELTKKTVKKLLEETKFALNVEAFEDIEALDKLAEKVASQTPDERRLLRQPYELCGIKFYPITLAKSFWFAEKVDEWQVEGIYQDSFLFWLLTLPLNAEVLDQYTTRKDAEKAVKKLTRRLHCGPDEMTEIYLKCVGKQSAADGGKKTEDKTSFGWVVALLLREYGGTPDQWLYDEPMDTIGTLVDQFVQKITAEQDAANRASPNGKAPAPSAKLKALRDFRIKTNEIKLKWSAAA